MLEDVELKVMQATLRELEPLDPAAARRVLIWLAAKLLLEDREETSTLRARKLPPPIAKNRSKMTSEVLQALLRSA